MATTLEANNGRSQNGAFDRIANTFAMGIRRAPENRMVQVGFGIQPFIYAGLAWRLMDKYNVDLPIALSYPVLRLLNAITPVSSLPRTYDDALIAAASADLQVVGSVVAVALSAAVGKKFLDIARGEGTINDPNSIIFLNVGANRRFAEPFGAHLQLKHKDKGKIRNVYFASLYPEGQTRPERPRVGFTSPHYAVPVDIQMDSADTALLGKAGTLNAPIVIITGDDDRVIEDTAYAIQVNSIRHNKSVRIIPIPAHATISDPYATKDQETGEAVILTEKPINPFSYFAEKLRDLTSEDESRKEAALDFLTSGIPNIIHKTRNERLPVLRKNRIREKLGKIGGRKPIFYLHGNPMSEEHRALIKALGEESVTNNLDVADIIISVVEGTNHTELNDNAEEMKDYLFDNPHARDTKIHLYLDFSQSNEDSTSINAEAGASIQRLVSEELTERVEHDVKIRQSNVLFKAIRKLFTRRIQQEVEQT